MLKKKTAKSIGLSTHTFFLSVSKLCPSYLFPTTTLLLFELSVGLVHTRAPQADLRPWHEKMGWWKLMLFAKTWAFTQQSVDNEQDNEPWCSNNRSPWPLVYHSSQTLYSMLERFTLHHNAQLLLFTCPLCGEQHSFTKCQRQKEKENPPQIEAEI